MNEEGPIADRVLKDIKKNFEFLFDRGYEIHSGRTINEYYDVWEVILNRQDFFVRFFSERLWIDLYFGSPSKGFVEIKSLTYFLSGGKDFVDYSLSEMGKRTTLLREHIDEFEKCLGSEFPKFEEALKSAEKTYNDQWKAKNMESVAASNKTMFSSATGIFLLFLLVYVIILLFALPSASFGDVGGVSIGLAVLTTILLRKRVKRI